MSSEKATQASPLLFTSLYSHTRVDHFFSTVDLWKLSIMQPSHLITQLISESYNDSHNRVKITPHGGVTIFGVNITPKRSRFFL